MARISFKGYRYWVEKRKQNGYWEVKEKFKSKREAEQFVLDKAATKSRVPLRVKKNPTMRKMKWYQKNG